MSFKRYKGPVETVYQAVMAHMVVTVECTTPGCDHWSTMWAWRIYEKWKNGIVDIPLDVPVDRFWCRECRRRVFARILPGMR